MRRAICSGEYYSSVIAIGQMTECIAIWHVVKKNRSVSNQVKAAMIFGSPLRWYGKTVYHMARH